MSFNDCKISESEIQTTGVQSQADTLTGSAADNKMVFDALPTLVIQKLNSLIDQMQQNAAAGQIGVTPFDGMTAQTLQAALEQIQADIGGNYGGADGAGKVGYTPSEGVDEDTVQAAIEAVQANLTAYIAKIKAATGAAEVGNAPIAGMTATNVQHALEELRENIDNIVSGIIPGGSITSDMLQDGAVTADKLGSDVAAKLGVLGGATTPQGALANLGAGVRPNLLDNAIFIGGGSQQGGGQLPVNQRGQTSYTAGGYTVDRWSLTGSAAKITVQADGIYYEKTADATSYSIWEQKLPLGELEGKELAVSVLVDDVCYSDTIAAGWTYSNGVVLKQFFINNGSKQMRVSVSCDADNILIFRFYYGGSTAAATTGFLLQAAKLEEGDTQNLAYQDDTGAWQLLPQPESDYATQLAKCKYYATMIASENILRAAASYVSESYIYFTIPLDVAMRQGNPTIVSSEGLRLYASITGNAQEGFSFSAQNNGNCVTLAAAKTSHGLTNGMLQMEKVLLSREL